MIRLVVLGFRASGGTMGQRVIFLDDDRDLREVVVALMALSNAECDAVASVDELKELVGRVGLAYDLAILDINLGADRPSGLDAYRWLRTRGFKGRVAFLTGHARSHPLVQQACRLGDAMVHDKPVSFEEMK